jgi:hypothetical protein
MWKGPAKQTVTQTSDQKRETIMAICYGAPWLMPVPRMMASRLGEKPLKRHPFICFQIHLAANTTNELKPMRASVV